MTCQIRSRQSAILCKSVNRMLISSTDTGLTDSIYLLQAHTLEPRARKFKKKEDVTYRKGLQRWLLYRGYMLENRIQQYWTIILELSSKSFICFFVLKQLAHHAPIIIYFAVPASFLLRHNVLIFRFVGISMVSSVVSLGVMRTFPIGMHMLRLRG